jgi:endonuclease/exonuclease/phosphatase family metal-dependent hydrolase
VKRAAVFAAVVLLAACAARPNFKARTAGREIVLSIVTWNVNKGAGQLARFTEDLVAGRLTPTPVRNFMILLQETIDGNENDAVALARSRNLYSYYDPVLPTERGMSGNAIISTLPLADIRSIPLPESRHTRKALAVTIELDGLKMFAICAHLENRARWLNTFGFFSDSIRKRQAKVLLAAIPPGYGFMGGDFNTWFGPTEPALKDIRKRFSSTPHEGPEPTYEDHLVLDHLFFDLPDRWEAVREVVKDRYGSDHHPVVALILQKHPS